MTKGLIKLQRKVLYKRLITSLKINNFLIKQLTSYSRPPSVLNLFDPHGLEDKRFTELGQIMKTKVNIEKMNDILTKIYRCTKYDPDIAQSCPFQNSQWGKKKVI